MRLMEASCAVCAGARKTVQFAGMPEGYCPVCNNTGWTAALVDVTRDEARILRMLNDDIDRGWDEDW